MCAGRQAYRRRIETLIVSTRVLSMIPWNVKQAIVPSLCEQKGRNGGTEKGNYFFSDMTLATGIKMIPYHLIK